MLQLKVGERGARSSAVFVRVLIRSYKNHGLLLKQCKFTIFVFIKIIVITIFSTFIRNFIKEKRVHQALDLCFELCKTIVTTNTKTFKYIVWLFFQTSSAISLRKSVFTRPWIYALNHTKLLWLTTQKLSKILCDW